MRSGFVGFDPARVEKLVIQLRGAAEDIGNMARQADQALDRVATLVPVNKLECDIGMLRGCGITIGEMSGDVQGRLTRFLDDQRFQATADWGEGALGGVSEALENVLESAGRWHPGRWVRGAWIPGRLVVEERWARFAGDGVVVEARSLRATHIPGRFGPSSWVEPQWVPDLAKKKAGQVLGHGMNALDVGLSAWGEWGARADLAGPERMLHAGLAGATEGLGSAFGGAAGYTAGAALAGLIVGTGGTAAVVIVAGGIIGAVAGSEAGQWAGGLVKKGVKEVGRKLAGGVKRVLGMFS